MDEPRLDAPPPPPASRRLPLRPLLLTLALAMVAALGMLFVGLSVPNLYQGF